MKTALNENWAGREDAQEMAEQAAGDAGEESGDGETDEAGARHIHARHLRRDIVVAHGAQGAAEARMHEAVDDVDREHEEADDPPEVGEAGNAGKTERAARVVDQVDDRDLHDDREAEGRHGEVVTAQPQHRPADEDGRQ